MIDYNDNDVSQKDGRSLAPPQKPSSMSPPPTKEASKHPPLEKTPSRETPSGPPVNPSLVYHGLVEEVSVRKPGYPFLIGSILLLALTGAIYFLGTTEGAALFSEYAHKDEEPSLKEKVGVLLAKVARLRAQSSYDAAYVLLRDFHELHPEESNVNRELGWHNMQKGYFVFAAEYYELSADVTPGNAQLNYYRGELHLRWGEGELRKTQSGTMNYREKERYITEAIDHYAQAIDFFTRSALGENPYNKDRSLEKSKEARSKWCEARYKKVSLQSIKVLAQGKKSRSSIEKALAELDALSQEESLSRDLKLQIAARIRALKKEL